MTVQAIDEPLSADTPALPPGVGPVARAYLKVLRARTALGWAPVAVGAVVLDRVALHDTPVGGLLMVLVPLLAVLATAIAPARIWRRLGYALEPAMLRVVRGWLFHSDTLVPLVRVQHLDIARGPFDKLFGTASLLVHTAGAHNATVTLPGLTPEDAEAMAAAIRTHIKVDLD